MLTKDQIKKTIRLMDQTRDGNQTFSAPGDKEHIVKITKRMKKTMKRLSKI